MAGIETILVLALIAVALTALAIQFAASLKSHAATLRHSEQDWQTRCRAILYASGLAPGETIQTRRQTVTDSAAHLDYEDCCIAAYAGHLQCVLRHNYRGWQSNYCGWAGDPNEADIKHTTRAPESITLDLLDIQKIIVRQRSHPRHWAGIKPYAQIRMYNTRTPSDAIRLIDDAEGSLQAFLRRRLPANIFYDDHEEQPNRDYPDTD